MKPDTRISAKALACALVFLLALGALPAQTAADYAQLAALKSQAAAVSSDSPQPDAQLAMSTSGYPVTAGDVYTLGYAAGTTPVTYSILVDPSYRVRVSNLAVIDVEGKTFLEFKSMVESVVTKNYPLSGVQLVLVSPAVFTVAVKGEVSYAREQKAWGLTRLSSVVKGTLTPYSSIRDILVTPVNGKAASYDLFRAERQGDLSQDPYVRPGDIVTVRRLSRSVTLDGAVERPGTYQLLEGEQLGALIRKYGNGLEPFADTSSIELTRIQDSGSPYGEKLYLDAEDIAADYALNNYDVVTVTEKTDLFPVIYVEGAIRSIAPDQKMTGFAPGSPASVETPASTTASSPGNAAALTSASIDGLQEVSNRVMVRINKGENYAFLIRKNRAWFSSVSDTVNAYVLRGEERIPLNLNPILYDPTYMSDLVVERNDILVIPFRQNYVTVAGAVVKPGRYPYLPNKDWSYYVTLAGGFDMARNNMATVSIKDVYGQKREKSDPVTPETTITASNSSFMYHFQYYLPIATTALAVITTICTIIDVTNTTN